MKKRNALFMIFALLVCLCFLTACDTRGVIPKAAGGEIPGEEADSLLEEADLNYEVPVITPGILVNQIGYLPNSEKIAIFRGENIPDTFRIIHGESGQVVFEGKVEEGGYPTYTGEENSYGVFSGVTKPGIYYVEAPVVGRSYFFEIGKGVYDSCFFSACKQYYYNRCGITMTEEFAGDRAHSACHTGKIPLREDGLVSLDVSGGWHQKEDGSKDVVKAASVVGTMLLTYELYPDLFPDGSGEPLLWNIPESGNRIPDFLDEIRYEMDWLLKMQDEKSGGIYSGVTIYASGNRAGSQSSYTAFVEPVSLEATAMYCAAMAKFSYLYQDFDAVYATGCLKAADRAWRYLEQYQAEETGRQEMYFLAAAEMYRAAGYQAYHTVITQFLGKREYREKMSETVLMGCITYLRTKMRVDKKLCGDIMKGIMGRAEEIAADSRKSQYLTAGNRQQDNHAALLEDMFFLSFVNYIIKNHEYGTVIENHLHYFCGRNAGGISYIDGVGANNYRDIDVKLGIMNQIELNSKLIFILSEIKSNAIAAE